ARRIPADRAVQAIGVDFRSHVLSRPRRRRQNRLHGRAQRELDAQSAAIAERGPRLVVLNGVRTMRLAGLTLKTTILFGAILWPIQLDSTAQAATGQQSKVKVDIVAERFRFTPDQIRVRLGATVEFHLESDDTDHGFRIVGTDVDRIIPKRGRGAIDVAFTPERAGRYTFECSKLCGAGHGFMHGELIVEE